MFQIQTAPSPSTTRRGAWQKRRRVGSLYLLGIHRHTGQFAQQVATFLEADHGPYGANHAHHRRRERRGVHSQGPVARTEAPLTFPTVVVGTFQFQFSDHTMKTFPSSFYITRPPATGTGQ